MVGWPAGCIPVWPGRVVAGQHPLNIGGQIMTGERRLLVQADNNLLAFSEVTGGLYQRFAYKLNLTLQRKLGLKG